MPKYRSFFFFFKQKTAYEIVSRDWSSDVCSSDLLEYIFANVILSSQNNHTLTIWLSYFYGTSRNTDWGALMAASTLTAIPVVIFFLLVQRKIAFGLTAGSVKG